jgi:transcription antitermination factor NusG
MYSSGVCPDISNRVTPDTQPWFAIRVRSNCERIVATALRNKGYEESLPVYYHRRRFSDRVKTVERPLFPGYVFGRFDPNDRLPILTTPGVVQIVGIRNVPAPVDSAEMAAIEAVVKSGLGAEPYPFLKIGDRIFIEEGPLAGLEGVLVESGRRYRLVAAITLLQRSVAVEIDPAWVRPGPLSRRSASGG